MTSKPDRYIPALSFHRLTPFYDPLLKWVMREDAFKRRLIAQAAIQDDQQVLDLRCGTGTLTLMVKMLHPQTQATGMDGDLEVLSIAKAKAERAGLAITWDHGLANNLPYPDGYFDRVLSSLMVHHLTRDRKRSAFTEVLRVLRPGGEFHIVDFGPPRTTVMRGIALVMRRMEEASDSFDGLVPGFLSDAGFSQAAETGYIPTLVGSMTFYRAVKPVSGGERLPPHRFS
jgi:ubiquinone/menaquinone biosynthesis C-methylase UbiE